VGLTLLGGSSPLARTAAKDFGHVASLVRGRELLRGLHQLRLLLLVEADGVAVRAPPQVMGDEQQLGEDAGHAVERAFDAERVGEVVAARQQLADPVQGSSHASSSFHLAMPRS
jgi:hypothetical protein